MSAPENLMREGWFRRFLTKLGGRALLRLLRRLGLAAGLGAATLLTGSVPARASAAAPRPNIVFILADDLGIGDVGPYGQQDILTPHIDELAGDGMLFSSAFCPATICTPTRCGMMTSLHGGHMTADRNDGSLGTDFPLRAEDVTVGEVLQQAGYVTGFYGKWGMGPGTNQTNPTLVPAAIETLPTRQGFDEMYGYLNQGRAHSYLVPTLWQDDPGSTDGVSLSATGGVYTHDLIAGRAEQFIADHAGGDEPFYLQASFTPPHWDLDAVPQQWKDLYAGRGWVDKKVKYAAMITHLDATVGQLVARIEDPDGDGDTSDSIASETLIVFCSDNGPAKEDGSDPAFFDSNGPYRGRKRDLYDGGVRTPFLARWDGVIAPGSTTDHRTGLEDFLPTAAELAGVDAPVGIDGVSIAPTLTGTGTQRERDFLVWDFHEGNGGVTGSRAPRWAVLEGDWKLIQFEDGGYELYNVAANPAENHNVVAAHPDVKARLEAIALAEQLDAPKGYAVQHRSWSGGGATGSWSDAGNWTGTGTPAENWAAVVENAAGGVLVTEATASMSLLGLELRGTAGEVSVDVPHGRTLTARNGVRISAGGRVNLRNAVVSTVREVDVRAGGALTGSGQVQGDLWNAGAVVPGQAAAEAATPAEPVDTPVSPALVLDFTGVQDDTPVSATSVLSPYLTVAHGLDFGPGVYPRHPDGGSTDQGDELNVSGFETTSLAGAVAQSDYLTFSVAPVAGLAVRLDSVRINLWRNGVNAAEYYALLTSIDGFAAGAELGSITILDSGIDNPHQLTASYAGGEQVTDVLEVRLYGWGGQQNGNTHFNAVRLDASFVSVPQQVLGPTGILALAGSYEQLDTGELAIDLTGRDNADPLAAGHDALHVAGDVTLGGTLSLAWLPVAGDPNARLGGAYDVVVYDGGRTGRFDAVQCGFSPYLLGVEYDAARPDGLAAVRVTLADPIPGDADLDGDVDGDDLRVLEGGLGAEQATWLDGDLNFDAAVDHVDYLLWKSAAAADANVPEPAPLVLLTLGAVACAARRKG